jgi:hypothetical protein
MNHEKHVIAEEVFTSVYLFPKYMRNDPGIINNVTYIVYKECSSHALMNEINENNYDMNVLWKGSITYLWVRDTDFVSMIALNSDFS